MNTPLLVTLAVVATLSLGLSACEGRPTTSAGQMVASGDVSEQLASEARHLAEAQSDAGRTLRPVRESFVGVERQPWKAASPEDLPRSTYLVIHYRYDDDTAIHTVVDLQNDTVLDRQELPHSPTPLGQEEFETARSLAMSDDRLRAMLGAQLEQVVVEAMPVYTATRDDRLFGRRVVSLFFRVGQDYIANLEVLVDLTNSNVEVTATENAR